MKISFTILSRYCALRWYHPTTAMCREPLCPKPGVTCFGMMSCIMSEGITPPSSLILAHAPDQNPPAVFDLTITTGLCRLPQAPAGRWPFPTLSLHSLHRRLDPCPAVSFRCTCPLLPGRQRPHLKRDRFGTPKILPAMQLQQGRASRGCSHSLMFRLPRSLDPQVAPTAESQSLQGGWAVYTTHSSVGYLPRDVASLRIRHGQLIRLDFHQLDCSLVGCSHVLHVGPHFFMKKFENANLSFNAIDHPQ